MPEAINNPLIQRLREEYVRLKREYQKMEERFQPDYPELQRTKVEMDSARKSLEDETQNLGKGAYSEFQTALKKERSLEAEFNEQKSAAFQMNSSAVLYNGLKVEIQNKKTLLDSLLRRESETGVEARLKGLRTSNIRVVDRARVPVRPSSPNKKRNLILALILGLGGGVGLAFLFDFLDNSVKTSEDVERYAGLPTLGVVPKFSLEGANKAYSYGRRLKAGKEPAQLAVRNGSRREIACDPGRRGPPRPSSPRSRSPTAPARSSSCLTSFRIRGWPRATGPSARRSSCPRPTIRSRPWPSRARFRARARPFRWPIWPSPWRNRARPCSSSTPT